MTEVKEVPEFVGQIMELIDHNFDRSEIVALESLGAARDAEVAGLKQQLEDVRQHNEQISATIFDFCEQRDGAQAQLVSSRGVTESLAIQLEIIRAQVAELVAVASRAVYFIPMGQPEYHELEAVIAKFKESED